jgi:hypothetical protein
MLVKNPASYSWLKALSLCLKTRDNNLTPQVMTLQGGHLCPELHTLCGSKVGRLSCLGHFVSHWPLTHRATAFLKGLGPLQLVPIHAQKPCTVQDCHCVTQRPQVTVPIFRDQHPSLDGSFHP